MPSSPGASWSSISLNSGRFSCICSIIECLRLSSAAKLLNAFLPYWTTIHDVFTTGFSSRLSSPKVSQDDIRAIIGRPGYA